VDRVQDWNDAWWRHVWGHAGARSFAGSPVDQRLLKRHNEFLTVHQRKCWALSCSQKWLLYSIDLKLLDLQQFLTWPDVVYQSQAARDVRPVSFPALYTPSVRPPPAYSTVSPASDRWTALTNWDYTRFVNGSWIFQRPATDGRTAGGTQAVAGERAPVRSHRPRSVRATASSLGWRHRSSGCCCCCYISLARDAADREHRLAARQPSTIDSLRCVSSLD